MITITFSGVRRSGKSSVMYDVIKLLRDNGYVVYFGGDDEIKDEEAFDHIRSKHHGPHVRDIELTVKSETIK